MGRTSDAKERLMEAATDLFWEHSYGWVTIDIICERAKVNKGSFYHFFESKGSLAVAALEVMWKEKKDVFDGIFSPTNPPLERLKQYFDYLYARQEEVKNKMGRVLGCPHFSLGAEVSTHETELQKKVSDILAQVVKYIESAVRDAKAEGLTDVADTGKAAQRLFIYVEGVLTQARISNSLEPVKNLYSESLELLHIKERVH